MLVSKLEEFVVLGLSLNKHNVFGCQRTNFPVKKLIRNWSLYGIVNFLYFIQDLKGKRTFLNSGTIKDTYAISDSL